MLSSLGKAGPPLFLNTLVLQLASGFGYGEEPWNQVALCPFLRGIISKLAPETAVSKMSTCMIACVSSLYAEEAPSEVQKRNADLVISLCQKSVSFPQAMRADIHQVDRKVCFEFTVKSCTDL